MTRCRTSLRFWSATAPAALFHSPVSTQLRKAPGRCDGLRRRREPAERYLAALCSGSRGVSVTGMKSFTIAPLAVS